jgi:hypothetical protein
MRKKCENYHLPLTKYSGNDIFFSTVEGLYLYWNVTPLVEIFTHLLCKKRAKNVNQMTKQSTEQFTPVQKCKIN